MLELHSVNGTAICSDACTADRRFNIWSTISITATLLAWNNPVKLVAGSATGGNVDWLTVAQA